MKLRTLAYLGSLYGSAHAGSGCLWRRLPTSPRGSKCVMFRTVLVQRLEYQSQVDQQGTRGHRLPSTWLRRRH